MCDKNDYIEPLDLCVIAVAHPATAILSSYIIEWIAYSSTAYSPNRLKKFNRGEAV